LIDGIEYLHQSGVAHLDLKPENLLLGANFNLKIADFDLSHVKGDEKILSRGTKYYRGPEFWKSNLTSEDLNTPFAADIYSAAVVLFILKSRGVYPHAEQTLFQGLDLADLMYRKNDKFWKKHCEIQNNDLSFFDKDFRELFNAMTKFNPQDRLSLKDVKKSKWYNGAVYTPFDLEKKLKEILKC